MTNEDQNSKFKWKKGHSKKRVLVLGSTGSVGTQALEVIRIEHDLFEVVGLSASQNVQLLEKQAAEFGVPQKHLALKALCPNGGNCTFCTNSISELKKPFDFEGWMKHLKAEAKPLVDLVHSVECDLVLIAVSGAIGIFPTLAAIRKGIPLALANKESLVVAGEWIMLEAKKYGTPIIPVDSEHSAIFQCLQTVDRSQVERIILPCSGGPFFGKTREELQSVTVEQALRHPMWNMGKAITIDSATLMNKGFEIIEAHHLFGFSYDQIDVLLHPQSIVHGMVQLKDGNVLMHSSPPDMRIPIHHALNYPDRKAFPFEALGIQKEAFCNRRLDFFEPDHETFPTLKIAYEMGKRGGIWPGALVYANEKCRASFLSGQASFLELFDCLEACLVKGHEATFDWSKL